MEQTVLIIGAGGMLGNALVQVFTATHTVVAWDKDQIDITDNKQVQSKIVALHPTIIINAAAYNNVDEAEQNPKAAHLANILNGEAVKNIISASEAVGACFVHYSSDYIFDGNDKSGYAENAVPHPINKYGESKLLGEKYVSESIDRGVPAYVIRLSRLFGPPGFSELGKKSFVDVIIEKAKANPLQVISIVNDEWSSPTYSMDLARFTLQLILDRPPYGVYHGSNSGVASWYTFAQKIFAIKHITNALMPVSDKDYKRPAARPHYTELRNTKRQKQRPWEEALSEYLT